MSDKPEKNVEKADEGEYSLDAILAEYDSVHGSNADEIKTASQLKQVTADQAVDNDKIITAEQTQQTQQTQQITANQTVGNAEKENINEAGVVLSNETEEFFIPKAKPVKRFDEEIDDRPKDFAVSSESDALNMAVDAFAPINAAPEDEPEQIDDFDEENAEVIKETPVSDNERASYNGENTAEPEEIFADEENNKPDDNDDNYDKDKKNEKSDNSEQNLDNSENTVNNNPIQDINAVEKNINIKKENGFVRFLKYMLPWKGDGVGEIIRKIVFLAASIVFIGAGIMLASTLIQSRLAIDDTEEVKEHITTTLATTVDSNGVVIELPPSKEDEIEHNFDVMKYYKDINEDVVGYIELEGCEIVQPVVQGDDNEYYLKHTYYNGTNKAGSIFMDYRCRLEQDYVSPNIVLYGHNQEDGTMFGNLKLFKQDVEFYKANPTVTFNTEYGIGTYLIYGYFVTEALDSQSSTGKIFHYQDYIETLNDETTFNWYMSEINKRNQIVSPVDVVYGDKLLCLSTCSNEFSNSRFVVLARKLRDGEKVSDYDFSTATLNYHAQGVDWNGILSITSSETTTTSDTTADSETTSESEDAPVIDAGKLHSHNSSSSDGNNVTTAPDDNSENTSKTNKTSKTSKTDKTEKNSKTSAETENSISETQTKNTETTAPINESETLSETAGTSASQ